MKRLTNPSQNQIIAVGVLLAGVGALFSPTLQVVAQPSDNGTSGEAQATAIPQPLATPALPAGASAPSGSSNLPMRTTRAIGTITGQGTVGNIAKFTGTNAIGNSVLFENGGKVGIGTTSPTGLFSATSSDGIGVYGIHSGAAGEQAGVQGDTVATVANAIGVKGTVNTASPGAQSAGVRGINNGTNNNGFGVYGSHAGGGLGVYGYSKAGSGVLGDSSSGSGVRGRHALTTGTAPGVNGETNSTDANAIGVQGVINSTAPGSASAGVCGINNGTGSYGIGVYGSHAGSGYGVYGSSPSGSGVFGSSANGYAVHGSATTGTGVAGFSTSSNGVFGSSDSGYGISGYSVTGYAGYFQGNVLITGNLAKSSGSFKIDHPLHPATEYLSHSFVESPDMKNIYDGNATLNAKGEALVKLPDYFQALNRDFRYQLTCIGAPALLYVAQEIHGNHFKIAGGKAGMKVSWMVTGIRNDVYARQHRIRVEETKTGADRGKYLYPAGFGAGEDKQIGAQPRRIAKR